MFGRENGLQRTRRRSVTKPCRKGMSMFAFILGVALMAFTYGGLSDRLPDQHDIVPDWVEAVVLGVVFTLSALRGRWSIAARWLLPFPSFLLFLGILTNRHPPMPFFVSFVFSLFYALFITAYAAYAAEKPR
jgi:lysylphosphatidylglycerol synthetase-like protein (DUF2156 family)